MNVLALVRDRIVDALRRLKSDGLLPAALDLTAVEISLPRDPAHGDVACNAALVLAKPAALRPRDLAERLAERLRGYADTQRVEVAGAGFLNLRFAPGFWHAVLAAILSAGDTYGRSEANHGEAVTVACVPADLADAMDVAHGRAAVRADALARLLACKGYRVTRAPCTLAPCPPVRLHRAGAPVRLSMRELMGEIGNDAVRFLMVYARPEATLDLDLAVATDQSWANPVFTVQYAHARAKSIFRNAQAIFPALTEGAPEVVHSDLSLLTDPGEIGLIKRLALFSNLLEDAARVREPHRLALYLYDLSTAFHAHYTLGNDSPHLRFMQPADGTVTAARLALVQAVAHVLAAGLVLLGVLAPWEMR